MINGKLQICFNEFIHLFAGIPSLLILIRVQRTLYDGYTTVGANQEKIEVGPQEPCLSEQTVFQTFIHFYSRNVFNGLVGSKHSSKVARPNTGRRAIVGVKSKVIDVLKKSSITGHTSLFRVIRGNISNADVGKNVNVKASQVAVNRVDGLCCLLLVLEKTAFG